jgi:hypothetical protein
VRPCTAKARDVLPGSAVLSMIRSGMPNCVNQSASTRPVGPAPTINTGNREAIGCGTLTEAMPQHYHHGLVVVPVVLAILASYTALTLALRLRSSSSVMSEGPGHGAMFMVRLPAIDAQGLEDAEKRRKAPRFQRKVLVVEDAEDTRRSLRIALEMNGHEVHTPTRTCRRHHDAARGGKRIRHARGQDAGDGGWL